ncbi:histidine kinase [Intrasporangium sp. DVR]|uniref:sensor histidine kinase n=1 Tax=Intrasporangium sp. DVR TaxID=3127867 RepID=UPI00313A6DC4
MTGASRRDRGPQWGSATIADLAIAVVLAAFLLTASLGAVSDSDLGGVWRGTVLGALVVLHAAALVRSRWPVATFAATSVAMLPLALAPDLSGRAGLEVGGPYSALLLPSSLVFFVALYTISSRADPPLPHLALGLGLLGAVITVARLWNADEYVTIPVSGLIAWRLFIAAAVTAGVVAAWSLGRYRATRIAWVSALEERAVRAERDRLAAIEQARADLERETERSAAAERRRIAREMHDVVAHSLAVVVGQAEGGRMLVESEPGRAREVLATIAEQGRQALTEMRSLLGVLRDDDTGPEAGTAPQPGLADLGRVLDEVRRAGTTVHLVEGGGPVPLPATADLAAFRVVQESLTNVVKHAPTGVGATVNLDWQPKGLRIRVRDGAPAPVAPPVPGRGLLGMRERLALVGGDLVHAGPARDGGGGFLIEAWVPRAPEARRLPAAGDSDPSSEPLSGPSSIRPTEGTHS